jgi:hypothetical protein
MMYEGLPGVLAGLAVGFAWPADARRTAEAQ